MPAKNATPVPIAVPHELLSKIEWVANEVGMSRQDVMRLAIRIGIEDLRRIGYKIEDAVVDSSDRAKLGITGATLAEQAAEYAKKKAKDRDDGNRR